MMDQDLLRADEALLTEAARLLRSGSGGHEPEVYTVHQALERVAPSCKDFERLADYERVKDALSLQNGAFWPATELASILDGTHPAVVGRPLWAITCGG